MKVLIEILINLHKKVLYLNHNMLEKAHVQEVLETFFEIDLLDNKQFAKLIEKKNLYQTIYEMKNCC